MYRLNTFVFLIALSRNGKLDALKGYRRVSDTLNANAEVVFAVVFDYR